MKGDKKAASRQQINNNMNNIRKTKGVITSQTKIYDCADHNHNGYDSCPKGGDGDMFSFGSNDNHSGPANVGFGSKLPPEAFEK